MKAIVKTKKAPGIEVLDVDVPNIGSNDILIKVAAGSLCGSDIHYYEWLPGSQFIKPPVILGHEFSGKVVEIGENVDNVAVGDRVSAIPAMPCGRCAHCRSGHANSCKQRLICGLFTDGFFAEYGRLTTSADIFKLPENVSDETAAMLEPLAVAMNAIDISEFRIGHQTAVLGPGPIGLLTLLLLKAGGASLIMMAGAAGDEKRLELAQRLGADITLNVEDEDPVKKTGELPGRRFDIVFEATGNPKSISQALDVLKPGGKLVLIGIHSGPAEFDATPFVRGKKSIIGAYGYDTRTWRRAINLLAAERIHIEDMITHRLPLTEAEEGFRLAMTKAAAKVLFIPGNAGPR